MEEVIIDCICEVFLSRGFGILFCFLKAVTLEKSKNACVCNGGKSYALQITNTRNQESLAPGTQWTHSDFFFLQVETRWDQYSTINLSCNVLKSMYQTALEAVFITKVKGDLSHKVSL